MYDHDGDYLSFEYKLQRDWRGLENWHPFQRDLLTDWAKNDDGDNDSGHYGGAGRDDHVVKVGRGSPAIVRPDLSALDERHWRGSNVNFFQGHHAHYDAFLRSNKRRVGKIKTTAKVLNGFCKQICGQCLDISKVF